MQTRFIVNPRSGAVTRVLPAVRIYAAGHRASLVETTGPRHAVALARQALADNCGLVVAVGGDGTLNEVATALTGTTATLGLVPCGSGNGLARHLGIYGDTPHALHIIDHGLPRQIDTGLADGHPFFTAAGLGFEATVSERFNHHTRRGLLRYLSLSATLIWRNQADKYHITHDGSAVSFRAFTLTVANSDQYGNGAFIAPGAKVDDGLLDLTAVPAITPFNALPLVARLFRGTLGRQRRVLRLQGTHFTIERHAPGLIHTDGETHWAGTRVDFTIRPRSLRVLAPAPR